MLDNVGLANRASATEIANKIGKNASKFPMCIGGTTYLIEIKKSQDLDSETKKRCFEIFESNMKQIYLNSSTGYKSKEKKRELFHKDSRFILICNQSKPLEETEEKEGGGGGGDPSELEGFLMWRFDFEETLNSDDVQVAYCYEIQLSPENTGKGLGKSLMELLEEIGLSFGMKKVMLTVQLENVKARKFYESLQFYPDEISPCKFQDQAGTKSDYQILSKLLDITYS